MNGCISFNIGPINTKLENVAYFNMLFLTMILLWVLCYLSHKQHNQPSPSRFDVRQLQYLFRPLLGKSIQAVTQNTRAYMRQSFGQWSLNDKLVLMVTSSGNTHVTRFKSENQIFIFSGTPIGNISQCFKWIACCCHSHENETWRYLSLNNDRLPLDCKHTISDKKLGHCNPYFIALFQVSLKFKGHIK